MVTFSLVMPCGPGSEKTVKKAVESLIDQDFDDWEAILVPNGEWDRKKFFNIIESLADNRVGIYDRGKEANVCLARNYGGILSKGKYLSFFSSDFYMFPGTLRKWKQTFEESEEIDFVYGGYQLMENGELQQKYVPSGPLDEDRLMIEPYIDGGFPVKRKVWEKVNWDPDIRSLNDWDWWIGIVKEGFEGKFIPDYTYAAEVPKAGGLSYDSHENWLERVSTIKKKHGVKERDICVVSLGAAPHGKRLAKILDADFMVAPQMKPHKYKMIYLIGFFFGDGTSGYHHANVFNLDNAVNKDLKRVVHWIGTDVLQLLSAAMSTQVNYVQMRSLIDSLSNLTNLTEFDQTHGELESVGIKSDIVPFPVEDKYGTPKMPKKFTVAIYTPMTKTANAIYNLELMKAVIKACPDIKFVLFGGGLTDFKSKNVENLGWTDMKTVIDKSSCLLRFTFHDGLPITPIEFRIAGRDCITSVQLPYMHHAGSGMVNKDNYSEKKEVLVKLIREIKSKQRGKKKATEWKKAREYWMKECDVKKYKKRIMEILHDAKSNKPGRFPKRINNRKKGQKRS